MFGPAPPWLLREKAAALKDFLPKGVLKRLEDLELLQGGAGGGN